MSTVSRPLRILCVCTYNRTRSVLAGALLDAHFRSLGIAAAVGTAGIIDGHRPPTQSTIDLLAERGLDVSNHRSRPVSEQLVTEADLIVTAEREHVVSVAGRWPQVFASTFALPEITARAADVGPRDGAPLDEWLSRMGEGRLRGLDYLEATDFVDVADPTGLSEQRWAMAVARIDDLTRRLAEALR